MPVEGVAPATPGHNRQAIDTHSPNGARGGRRSCDAWSPPTGHRHAFTELWIGNQSQSSLAGARPSKSNRQQRPRRSAALRNGARGGRRSCDAWSQPTGRRHAFTELWIGNQSQSSRAGARPSGTVPVEGVAPATPGHHRQAIDTHSPSCESEARAKTAAQERGPPNPIGNSGRAGARPSGTVPVEGVAPATPGHHRQAIDTHSPNVARGGRRSCDAWS